MCPFAYYSTISKYSVPCVRIFNGPVKENFTGKTSYKGNVKIRFIFGSTFVFLSQAVFA
jgi:hypothetical protein